TTPSTNERDFGFVNQRGLSRKQIFDAIEASLKNLGVDYLDLFQIHRFDNHTPVEETVETLHNLVKLGKCYVQQYDKELIHANLVTGASSMWAWQFSKMNHVAETREWTKFVSQQNHYNLLYREEEREMNPYCLDAGIGLIPWSPLAGGKLTGKKRDTERAKMFGNIEEEGRDSISGRMIFLDRPRNKNPAITAPIVGITKERYLGDAVRSLEVKLTPEEHRRAFLRSIVVNDDKGKWRSLMMPDTVARHGQAVSNVVCTGDMRGSALESGAS
ncbi:NADP-dependent oxidoreductase domain-containing protein, partial [Jimgerdemannia flammicorona]